MKLNNNKIKKYVEDIVNIKSFISKEILNELLIINKTVTKYKII